MPNPVVGMMSLKDFFFTSCSYESPSCFLGFLSFACPMLNGVRKAVTEFSALAVSAGTLRVFLGAKPGKLNFCSCSGKNRSVFYERCSRERWDQSLN